MSKIFGIFFGLALLGTTLTSAQHSYCHTACNWCSGTCHNLPCDTDQEITCDLYEGYCDTCTCQGCAYVDPCEGLTNQGTDCSIECIYDINNDLCWAHSDHCRGCKPGDASVNCKEDCEECFSRGCHFVGQSRETCDCYCDDDLSCWGQSCGAGMRCENGLEAETCACFAICDGSASCGACADGEICQRDVSGLLCECKTCGDKAACGNYNVVCTTAQECTINSDGSDCECKMPPTDPPTDPPTTDSAPPPPTTANGIVLPTGEPEEPPVAEDSTEAVSLTLSVAMVSVLVVLA